MAKYIFEVKKYAPATNEVTRLCMIDRGSDITDRYLVVFDGCNMYWGSDYNEALSHYEGYLNGYVNG